MNNQRKNSKSNSDVGKKFETNARNILEKELGISFAFGIPILLGFEKKKEHKFDLGNLEKKIIVECKSHTWTESNKTPSAKMTVWNEAMLYFSLCPQNIHYRKIFFVLKNFNEKKKQTLAEYYLSRYIHLIPPDVEIWEYDEETDSVVILKNSASPLREHSDCIQSPSGFC